MVHSLPFRPFLRRLTWSQYLKHIEKAIYTAELPGMTPHKVDDRTLKIPVPQ